MGRERQRANKKFYTELRKKQQRELENFPTVADTTDTPMPDMQDTPDMSSAEQPSPEEASAPVCGSDVDTIALSKLQLEAIAPSVWGGQPKLQPALLSVTLVLRDGFRSAGSKDELDESTIHYGELAKRIRGECGGKLTLETLFPKVEGVCASMAMRGDGTCRVLRSMVVVRLPQASMYGEGCEMVDIVEHDGKGGGMKSAGWIFAVKDVKVMLLVGLKKEERWRKQPVVVDLDVNVHAVEGEFHAEKMVVRNDGLFGIERKLVEIIQDTTFGTLEALANFTVGKLQDHIIDEELPCSRLHLSLSKPRVIDFAEGPRVDVVRNIRRKKTQSAGVDAVANGPEASKLPPQLKIIKPYV